MALAINISSIKIQSLYFSHESHRGTYSKGTYERFITGLAIRFVSKQLRTLLHGSSLLINNLVVDLAHLQVHLQVKK